MAAETILFFGDLLHYSNTELGPVVTASGTAAGYHVDNVRDTNLSSAWKDSDSTTADIWLEVDGDHASWLGAANDTAYVAIAYDARDNQQDTLKLEYGAVDDGAFATPTVAATFTLVKLGTAVQCQYASFSIPATAKRYWRLIGYGNERTEAGGSQVPKIYCFSMFDKDTVFKLGTSPYADVPPGAGQVTPVSRVGVARTAIGSLATNKHAEYGMQFDTSFQPASAALWEVIRDEHAAQSGPLRGNFVQHEGLRNTAQPDFFLCRLASNEFPGQREYIDQVESALAWVTEPWL